MPLTAGTRLGHYDILAPLGAGGMGEVFLARDTRLGRDVAIKALPAEFERNPERLARFEREARLLASLSHPAIAGIHGLEVVEGHRYLALEYVDGETLAARLGRGPLLLDEALEICRQVATGIEAAHESGVVHRDLKPGNVMLTRMGAVKVLDFGLARSAAAGGSSSGPELSASPTMTLNATGAGVILGTAAYMSPEQARGRPVDRRTDVWSFGCVLFECLTGRQAYEGETVSDLIARILEREPDWSALPSATPPRVVELLRRCLTKDATLRLRDIGEARIVLTAPHAAATAAGGRAAPGKAGGRARRWMPAAIAAALATIATAATLLTLRPAHPPGPVRRFRVPVEGLATTFMSPVALTRDGTRVAYQANGRLWIRPLGQVDAVEIPGSAGGRAVFWSWDQRTLAFETNKKLWTFAPGADQSKLLCNIPGSGSIVGGAWGADGRIVMAVWRGGLCDVPVSGGEARSLLPNDSLTVDFHSPTYLPDGRTLLVVVHDKRGGNAVGIVDGSPAHLTRVLEDPKAGVASYSATGHLLVTHEDGEYQNSVWAVPFSAARRKVTGPSFQALDGAAYASASDDGMLVAVEDPPPPSGQMVWRRRDGSGEEVLGEPQRGLTSPALSPDGRRVAYVALQEADPDIWVLDLVRGTRTRLTTSPVAEGSPAWSQDGQRIYFDSYPQVGGEQIVSIASDGSGSADTLTRGFQPSPSPDGKSLAYLVDRQGNADLWTVRLDGSKAARPFLATPSQEAAPAISPDGHWIAYMSNESGDMEVYIRRYPEGDARMQVSVGGGKWPRWSRRGDAICYVDNDTLTAVSIGPGPHPGLGLPHALFAAPAAEFTMTGTEASGFPIDVAPDGSHIIGVRRTAPPSTRAMLIIENWSAEFRKR